MKSRSQLLTVTLVVCSVVFPSTLYSAFEPGWSYTYSATGVYSGWRGLAGAVAFDETGNVIVGGAVWSPSNTTVGVIFKLDSAGEGQWETVLGDIGTQQPTKLLIRDSGFIFAVGINDSFGTGYDYWTTKVSPVGELLWSARYNNANATSNRFNGDRPADLAIDDADNVYVTGRSYAGGPGTPFDFATVKYAGSDGSEQWVQRYDSRIEPSNDLAYTVLYGPSNNVTVVGIGSRGFYQDEIVVIVYDTSGTQRGIARHNFGGAIYNGLDAKMDGAGNLIIACSPNSSTYLLKFDSSARLLWTKQHALGAFPSLDIDPHGRILLSGTVSGAIAVGTFTTDGDEIWSTRFEGVTSGGAKWQDDGSVLAVGAGSTNASGPFGAIGVGFDAVGNLTDLIWDGRAYPRTGTASKNGRIVFAGETRDIVVSEYRRIATIGQPRIVQQPAPVTTVEGNNVTFAVLAEGPGPLRFQWRSAWGGMIPGATNSILVLSNVSSHSDGNGFSVEVRNDLGWTRSPEAKLTVLVPPRLGSSYSLIAVSGEDVSLSADAWYATQPVTNEWFFEGVQLPTRTNRLVMPNIQANQAGVYRAEARNAAGFGIQEWRIAVSSPMPITWATQALDTTATADLDLDPQGNAFVTSSTTQNGRAYILTAKFLPNGTRQWSQTFGGASIRAFGDAIKRDGTGHFYVAGRPTADSVCLLKYDEYGSLLWTNLLAIVPASTNARTRLELAQDGGCYLGITAKNQAGDLTIALARFAPSGLSLWQTSITTNNSGGAGLGGFAALPGEHLAVVGRLSTNGLVMVIDQSGNIVWQDLVETGEFGYTSMSLVASDGTGRFVVGGSSQLLQNQIFLGKYSTQGDRVWFHRFPKGALGFNPSGLLIDSAHDILLAVRQGTVTFLKLTGDGIPVWTNSYAGQNFNGTMRLDAADNIHYVGVGFDLGLYFGYAAVKFDSAGRLLALSRYSANALNSLQPDSFAVHHDGSIYVAGILGGRLSVVKHGRQSIPTMLSLTRPNEMQKGTLRLNGEPGFSYTIESSASLDSWLARTNAANLSGTIQIQQDVDEPHRFFRAIKNP